MKITLHTIVLAALLSSTLFGMTELDSIGLKSNSLNAGSIYGDNGSYRIYGSFGEPLLVRSTSLDSSITITSGFWATVFGGQSAWFLPGSNTSPIVPQHFTAGQIAFNNNTITISNGRNNGLPYAIAIYTMNGSLVKVLDRGTIQSEQEIVREIAREDLSMSGTLMFKVQIGAHVEGRVFNLNR